MLVAHVKFSWVTSYQLSYILQHPNTDPHGWAIWVVCYEFKVRGLPFVEINDDLIAIFKTGYSLPVRLLYIDSFTGKTTSWYWIRAHIYIIWLVCHIQYHVTTYCSKTQVVDFQKWKFYFTKYPKEIIYMYTVSGLHAVFCRLTIYYILKEPLS